MIMTFTGCNINGFVGSVAALSEIWSLSAVSFDRFKCVHNPLNRSKRIKTSEVKISILLVIKSQFHKILFISDKLMILFNNSVFHYLRRTK